MPSGAVTFEGSARFEVLEPLGVGATCLVYKVRDRDHGDVVALKTLRHLDAASLYRLKSEFRSLAGLDHPNLVSYYELVADGDSWLVTMELVRGADFLTWCRGGEPSPVGTLPDLVRLRSGLRQLAEGVAALHAAGRIHRDLKPSNVLVTDAGRIVILDFGLVADADQDYTDGTAQQSIAGSAAYMSPEAALGIPLTPAADWYAIGVMLYEALTGVWPFQGHLFHILATKQQRDPQAPSTLLPDVPDDLDDLCMALLARDPARRPSAAEILHALGTRLPIAGVSPSGSVPRLRNREAHLHRLEAVCQAVRWGKAAVALVRGEPGMGKTALVREFVKRLRHRERVHVLKGRCYSWENVDFRALDSVADNLSRHLKRMDPLEVEALATDEVRALAGMFPVLRRVEPLGLEPEGIRAMLHPEERTSTALRGWSSLLRGLSETAPVLLFIDDVDQGDADSARILAQAMPELSTRRVLVVLAFRPDLTTPFMDALLPALARSGLPVHSIDVDPLPFEDACHVASQWTSFPPTHPLVCEIALRAGGVPQQIKLGAAGALVRGTGGRTEVLLTAAMIQEIRGLPTGTARILELVAVAGPRPVPTEVVLRAAALPEGIRDALATLQAFQLVYGNAETGSVEIVGNSVRDFVLDRIGDDALRQHHRDLAAAIELSEDTDPIALVSHYAGAGRSEAAGVHAWLSAKRAVDHGSYADAAWLIEQAVELGRWSPAERRSMLVLLGQAHARVGQAKRAAEVLLRAASDAPEAKRLQLTRDAVSELLGGGHHAEGVPLASRLMGELGVARFPHRRCAAEIAAWRRLRLWWRGEAYVVRPASQVASLELERVDLAWLVSGAVTWVDRVTALALHRAHLLHALNAGEPMRVARALAQAVLFAPVASQDAAIERATRAARDLGTPEAEARVQMVSGVAAFRAGRFDVAALQCGSALVSFRSLAVGAPWEAPLSEIYLMRAALFQGDLRAVATRLLPLRDRLAGAEQPLLQTFSACGLGVYLRLAEDAAEVAWQEVSTAREAWTQVPFGIPHALALCATLAVDLYRGRALSAWKELQAARVSAADLDRLGPTVTTELHLMGARVSLAMAAISREERSRYLKTARAALALARRNPAAWASATATWLEVLASDRPTEADALAALQSLDSAGLRLVLAVARHHLVDLGRIRIGDAVARGDVTWLADQGVRNPGRWANLVAPGLDR